MEKHRASPFGEARLGTPATQASRQREAEAQAEATERCRAELAKLGIDMKTMTPTEALNLYHGRGCGSSYTMMTRDVVKGSVERCKTPVCFKSVLRDQASAEVRYARDMPVTRVSESLDHWEVEYLADVCRSLKYFGELAAGTKSEYMRMYPGKLPRKPFATRPDL